MTGNQKPSENLKTVHQESKWTGHISKWLESGQSQSAYCKEHNLKYALFNQAVKRHRKFDKPEESEFVEMSSLIRSSEAGWSLAISFPNGMQLQTSGPLPATQLMAILKELRG